MLHSFSAEQKLLFKNEIHLPLSEYDTFSLVVYKGGHGRLKRKGFFLHLR